MKRKLFSCLILLSVFTNSKAAIVDVTSLFASLAGLGSSPASFDSFPEQDGFMAPSPEEFIPNIPFMERLEVADNFVSGTTDISLSETASSFLFNVESQHIVSNIQSNFGGRIELRLSLNFTPTVDSVLSINVLDDFQVPAANEGLSSSVTNFALFDASNSFEPIFPSFNPNGVFTANLEAGTNYFLTLDASTVNIGGFFDVEQGAFVFSPPSTVIANQNFSLEITAVPLPAASWLLLSGLLGLVRFKKKV